MKWTLTALGALVVIAASPAHALTMQECSAKYKDAQKAGTLAGKSWADFRKAECGSQEATAKAEETKTAAKSAAPKPAAATTPSQTDAKFPSAVDPKYAKEKDAKARMKSCLDQYNANKAANANGGLKWIQKGGGYYSECNKRLKGTA
jgi:hypothetical protein